MTLLAAEADETAHTPRRRSVHICAACGEAFGWQPWRRDDLTFCSELCAEHGLRQIERVARSVR
jgi:hypothetical protein